MKVALKIFSTLLLLSMLVTICAVGWYGMSAADRNEISEWQRERMEESDDLQTRAASDGQYTGWELFHWSVSMMEKMEEYTDDSSYAEWLNEWYTEEYGVNFYVYFMIYGISLICLLVMLIMIVVYFICHCCNLRGPGWPIIPLSFGTMLFYIINATSEYTDYRLLAGGFLTLALAVGSTVLWSIGRGPKKVYVPVPYGGYGVPSYGAVPYTPPSVKPPEYTPKQHNQEQESTVQQGNYQPNAQQGNYQPNAQEQVQEVSRLRSTMRPTDKGE